MSLGLQHSTSLFDVPSTPFLWACTDYTNFGPAHHFQDTQHAILLSLGVPGILAEDLTVELGTNVIFVKGENHIPGCQSIFARRFSINPGLVDAIATRANLIGGVLTLIVPKVNKAPLIILPITQHAEAMMMPEPAEAQENHVEHQEIHRDHREGDGEVEPMVIVGNPVVPIEQESTSDDECN